MISSVGLCLSSLSFSTQSSSQHPLCICKHTRLQCPNFTSFVQFHSDFFLNSSCINLSFFPFNRVLPHNRKVSVQWVGADDCPAFTNNWAFTHIQAKVTKVSLLLHTVYMALLLLGCTPLVYIIKHIPTGLNHRPSSCLLFIPTSSKSSKRKLHNWRHLLQLKYGLTAELCLPFTFLFIIPIPSKELLRMVFLSLCAALEQLK